MPTEPISAAWWLAPLPVGQAGLSEPEARASLARHGPNVLQHRPQRALLLQYLARFQNPLIVVLLGASALAAFSGELADCLIIGLMVVLSATLDFFQEHRASRAVDKLRQSVCLRAHVVRDGRCGAVPTDQLVPGDLVLLAAGDLVPADGVVLEADDFFVNQALWTGESCPVEKRAALPPATATGLEEASNALFMGTAVISGSARMLVRRTGKDTAIGALAGHLAAPPPPSAFELGARRFGMLIMRLTVMMVLFVLLASIFSPRPLLDTLLFAVALAVGLTPELLPMVVSVTLARGALRMGKQDMIVKRLSAIQDLGSMDVLCTDKTGTLTEATIQIERHVDALGRDSERVLELAYLNSTFETGLRSPLDQAILAHAHIDTGRWRKIDELPFDFERRRVSVLIDDGSTRRLVVKGAADDIVGLCDRYETAGEGSERALDSAARARIGGMRAALEADGLRILAIAWRAVANEHSHAGVDDEARLVLAGFAAFFDPPKESAAGALSRLGQLGIAIKVVTGDSDLVTRHLCARLGIAVSGLLTGKEIAQMDEQTLGLRVDQANVFCRINPTQKHRIIVALKARGHVVGYLGDGINDAPSLHAADVGISVDSAVDVAREAADMILLKQDLQVLHGAVLEGRRTFANIMKYMLTVTSSNFGNMFSMVAASLFLPFLPMLPTQILLNNILYDISQTPLPLDRVDSAELRRPRQLDLGLIRNFMLVIGAVSSLFDFLTFYLLLAVLQADERLFQTGWFVESLCTQVLVIFILRTRGRALDGRAHPLLASVALAVVLLASLLPFTPVGAYFSMAPLPAPFYLLLGALTLAYLCAVELAKRGFYRWHGARQSRPGA